MHINAYYLYVDQIYVIVVKWNYTGSLCSCNAYLSCNISRKEIFITWVHLYYNNKKNV